MDSSRRRVIHETEVVRVEPVTPLMRRIAVKGESLKGLVVSNPGEWVKVFFSDPSQSDDRPQSRAYTIRGFDPVSGEMLLDFVLHGDHGIASRWAGEVRVGDKVSLSDPRRGYRIDADAPAQLLLGDATALPAIAAILENLPVGTPATMIAEVVGVAEEQSFAARDGLEAIWVHADPQTPGTSGKLLDRLRQVLIPKDVQVFIAGEHSMVTAARDLLRDERGVARSSIDAVGYWRYGQADHRDLIDP